MKKIYVLALVVLFAGTTFAQNIIVPKQRGDVKKMQNHQSMKLAEDTLMLDEFFADVPTFYGYTGGGYWIGVNIEGNTKSAQGYMNLADIAVEEVLIWAGEMFKLSANGSTLKVSINALDDSSSYGPTGGPYFDIVCPGTELGSVVVPFAQVDTGYSFDGGVTHATFATPVHINGVDFSCVVDYSNWITNGDSIGFVTSYDGGGSGTYGVEYNWWLYPAASPFWTQISHVFNGADNAIGFFPVFSAWVGLIENPEFVNGVKLGQNYPNPSLDGKTRIDYAIENEGSVKIEVYNYNGQLIEVVNEGNKAAGQYTVTLNTQLSAGVYYYSLMANNFRLTKKMIIE